MLKPVYALVGSDPFLQLQKLQGLLRSVGKAGVQRIDADGERAGLAEVFDELRSFAMFGGAKLVVMRNADEFLKKYREQLEDYVAAPSESGTLVLRLSSLPANQRIYKAIAKVGEVVPCEPPKDLAGWVMSHGKAQHGVTVAPDAARMLADLIGDDLGRLDMELSKLAVQVEGDKIGPADVSGTVAFQREQEMWDMTNELAAGQPAKALERWRQLLTTDSSAEFRAVTWLTMWLEDVGQVVQPKRGSAGAGKISWKYKDRFSQFLKTANTIGPKGYARAVDLLAELDKQTKSGVGEAAGNVERFILAIGGRC